MNQPEQIAGQIQTGLSKKTNYRWVVMVMLFAVWMIANADRANLGVALPYMKKEFSLSNTEAGAIVSLFAFAYAFVQIPTGLFYKRVSPKISGRLLPVFLFLVSLFTGLMGTTASTFLLKLWRIGLGFAEGPLGIGCTNVINRWFPPKEKGTATGLYIAASKLGPVMVPVISVLIIEMFGWREIFYFFAIPGIILAVLWALLVTNSPSENRFCSPAEVDYIQNSEVEEVKDKVAAEPKKEYNLAWLDKLILTRQVKQLENIGQIFCSWNIIANALAYGCMIGISNTFMAWIPTYLMTVKGFTSIKMGFLASAPFIGSVLGNTIGGLISDRILNKRRKPLMMVGAICTIATTYALVYAPNNPVYLGAMLLLAGMLLGLGYAGYTVYPMGLASKEIYPLAFGIVNTGGQLGGAITPLLVGIILDKYSWNSVFLYLALSSLLCFMLLSTIVEPVLEKKKN